MIVLKQCSHFQRILHECESQNEAQTRQRQLPQLTLINNDELIPVISKQIYVSHEWY